jgi:UMF1 family MFS transporter
LATVAGTFSFGVIEAITGSMRYSVLAITVFFMLSLVFIFLLFRRTRIEARS